MRYVTYTYYTLSVFTIEIYYFTNSMKLTNVTTNLASIHIISSNLLNLITRIFICFLIK